MKIHLQIVLIGLAFTNLSQTQPSYLAQPASPTELKAISFGENTNIDYDHSPLPHESLIDADDNLNQNSPNITSVELKAPILQSIWFFCVLFNSTSHALAQSNLKIANVLKTTNK